MQKFILINALAFTFLHSSAMAATENTHCTPLEVKNENKEIVLPGPDESKIGKIYFIKNSTEKSIWLDHPVLHPSVSAGWSSYLRAGHSSAILVNRKDF